MSGRPFRVWAVDELRRARRAVESGVPLHDVARRFRTHVKQISALAHQYGWTVPYAAERSVARRGGNKLTQAAHSLRVAKAREAKRKAEADTFDERMALSRCRHLVRDGVAADRRAARRKAELEARAREEATRCR